MAGSDALNTIDVPDIEGPTVPLCYQQKLNADRTIVLNFARCDRKKGHGGMHTWELWDRIQELEKGGK
jgi:hypothetical protein